MRVFPTLLSSRFEQIIKNMTVLFVPISGPILGPVLANELDVKEQLGTLPGVVQSLPTPSGFTHPFRIYPPLQNLPTSPGFTLHFLFSPQGSI